MKTYLATTTLTDLTEITMNTDLPGPVRAYYVVTDEDQGSEYEVTLTYGGDYDGVSEETLNLPFTTEVGGKYYYSCTWKVLTKVSDSSSSAEDYILLEYSETDEITIPCWDDDQIGIQIDWDASGTGDVEEFLNGNNNNWQPLKKTWSDTQPRTIKITGNITRFSASSVSHHASQNKMTSATVSGMSTITNAFEMFGKCKNMTSLDISNFDVTNLIYASYMFDECQSLTGELDLSHFSVAKFQGMTGMFRNCKNLTSINTTGWDTSDATGFGDMFNTCENLESLDISHWDYSSNIYNFWWMFNNCKKLITLNGYQNFPIESQVNTKHMFYGCNVLESLDLTNWEMSTVENAQMMFGNCYALNSISGISDWDFSSVTSSGNMYAMFYNATSLTNLDISGWCVPNIDEPNEFAVNALFANTSSNLPVWGTCPTT